MSKTLKWIIAIVVIILIIAGVYYYGAKPATPVETGPVKIGVIGPLTGDAAIYGKPFSETVALAIEEVNAAGGVNGRKIEIIAEDGKCSGQEAATAMQKLVNIDKVQVVIGGFCSSESLAAVPIAEQNKVLLISPGSSSPDLTGISKYFVRDYPSDATQGQVLAEAAIKKGWKKVAFLQEQTDYCVGIYKAFSSRFIELGGKVVKEELASSATDFKTQIGKLRGQKPDALFIDMQTPVGGELVIKQLQELKWKTPMMAADAVSGSSETIKKYPQFLEGTLAAEFGVDTTNPKFQHMVLAYKAKYGKEADYPMYEQTMWDAALMLVDGLKAVGNNGEKLAEWFRQQKGWEGSSGRVTIGENGDRVGGHVLKVIHNGVTVPANL
ncbi:MAG: ABC transporter substrate-binding protein [Candidatus Paceibacterota bacterium]|jgi:branched-chain amino acid transport system substrate-binding protein